MQPAPNVEQRTTAQVLTELLSLVGKAGQTWVDLLAEDDGPEKNWGGAFVKLYYER